MKTNKLIILFLFVFNTVFCQTKTNTSIPTDSTNITKDSTITKVNYNQWSIDVGTGVSIGTGPYSDGYYTSRSSQFLNCYTVGVGYNFSKLIGIKMDLAFDRFINSKIKPYEAAQFRTSIQGILNLSSLARAKKDISRFNLLFHAGIHIAILEPISADYNKKASKADSYGGIVFGITPTVRITKKTAVFLDFSSFSNYGQNLTWNGKYSKAINNSEGHMFSGTFGLSFVLDKKQ